MAMNASRTAEHRDVRHSEQRELVMQMPRFLSHEPGQHDQDETRGDDPGQDEDGRAQPRRRPINPIIQCLTQHSAPFGSICAGRSPTNSMSEGRMRSSRVPRRMPRWRLRESSSWLSLGGRFRARGKQVHRCRTRESKAALLPWRTFAIGHNSPFSLLIPTARRI